VEEQELEEEDLHDHQEQVACFYLIISSGLSLLLSWMILLEGFPMGLANVGDIGC